MAAISLAKVSGINVKDIYETDDPNFMLVAEAVVDKVVSARESIARHAQRGRRPDLSRHAHVRAQD
jgi:hypothetical protein